MGYTNTQAKEFIKTIAPLIQSEARERGYIVCSTVIAQAIVESGITSTLAVKYHNYFGMKAGKNWRGGVVNLKTKEEYQVGTLVTIVDGFRTYPTMADGVKGYYDFISTKRYANLKTARDHKEYARNLKLDGYATSSTYVNTLISTVNRYDLTVYDAQAKVEYYPPYEGDSDSIVTALAVVGEKDTSKAHRGRIYVANGFLGTYTGTAKQNEKLLLTLRQGNLIKCN